VLAFLEGLNEAGYSEGRDVVIEWRSFDDYDQVPPLVLDLLQRNVEVIVVEGTVAAQAVKRATSRVPIVMALVADPVGSGLVTSFAHPGGNVTGLSLMLAELTTKRLQLLKEAFPQASRVAVFWNSPTPWHARAIEGLKVVAASLSSKLSFVDIQASEDIGPAFSTVTRARVQALYPLESALFYANRMTIAKLALQAQLPSMFGVRQFVDAGGLMSYGASFADLFRRSAGYVDRILKGAKPGDLPVEQPTKFEMVVNLKTAAALGITIPQPILVRADEVIR
jgi:putative ABC transport system substrate-binding protein